VYASYETPKEEGKHLDAVPTYFEEELKFLEEWIAKPKTCENHTKVISLSCEDMKEDRNKSISADEMEGIILMEEEKDSGEIYSY